MPIEDNKRIAKNTFFLYVRMILTIIVNLYAVRVIWQILGVDDYGIYNVVGGIIMMFAFINTAMVSSSQRFISYELGTGDMSRLSKVFSLSMTVHIYISVLILVLAETLGLWFLNARLNIPPDRLIAANWVYQCSVIAFLVNVISVPYNACIVAHEHMKAFGYFGIMEAVLKLVIVFLLILIAYDKLIVYAILVLAVSAVMRLVYGIYCKRHFEECRYIYVKDHRVMRDMFSFAGWSFIGNIGFSFRDQGLNIILNLFFNVAVNAAKGIANQIGYVVSGFAQNFQIALSPQITKRYAAGERTSMMTLVISGCKYSALLVMLIVIPLFCAGEQVLTLWLGDVAPFTVGFMQLVLVMVFIDSMAGPVTAALQATGRIKWFQIAVSIIMLSNLPLAWIWLKLDANPYVVVIVCLLTSTAALITRLILLHREVPFSYRHFISQVCIPVSVVMVVSGVLSWLIYSLFPHTMFHLVLFVVVSVLIISGVSFVFGLRHNERTIVLMAIKKRLNIR